MTDRTENLFQSTPTDGRQDASLEKPSRFRPKYRNLSVEEKAAHDAIKAKAEQLESLIEALPSGRYKALALTDLESSIMWAVKQLTA